MRACGLGPFHEGSRGHIAAQVHHLEAGRFQHDPHQILANVVRVALHHANHHDALLALRCPARQVRLQHAQTRIHGVRADEQLGNEILLTLEQIARPAHAVHQPRLDATPGINPLHQQFLRKSNRFSLVHSQHGVGQPTQ